MRFVFFYHSLRSDWNHGNAHFLRGVASELLSRGHEVKVFEPFDGWSLTNLVRDHGLAAASEFQEFYPGLESSFYDPAGVDLDAVLRQADVVLVHEWNPPELVRRIGEHHARSGRYVLLFHDTHHRSVTEAQNMKLYDLRHFDGVLAFGGVISRLYLQRGWTHRCWTWHEAADTRMFFPRRPGPIEGDLVWIGNWSDEDRGAELREYLIEPIRELGLRATVFGARYPESVRRELASAGIHYGGWLPNFRVPEVFARFRVTIHIPRRPYVEALPGIPTIRVFEALACGIPLVSTHWDDAEELLTPGEDYLLGRTSDQIAQHLLTLLGDPDRRRAQAMRGLRTIQERHTCVHRVDQLLEICREASGTQAHAKESLCPA